MSKANNTFEFFQIFHVKSPFNFTLFIDMISINKFSFGCPIGID